MKADARNYSMRSDRRYEIVSCGTYRKIASRVRVI